MGADGDLPSMMNGMASVPCFLAHSFNFGSDILHAFKYLAVGKKT